MNKSLWLLLPIALFFFGCGSDDPKSQNNTPPLHNITECEGVDLSRDCRDDGCDEGDACVPNPAGCRSSSCECTDNVWVCTEDCLEQYHCVNESDICDEPDPSIDCTTTGCEDGLACLPAEGCKPSACFCEEGLWTCTADCGERFECQEADSLECLTPDPSVDCQSTGCADGLSCEPLPEGDPNYCLPSSCMCTGDGNWACTRDCGQRHSCVAATCTEPNPAGCTQEGCPDGEVCQKRDDVCAPSQCFCASGDWACTRDCGGGGVCVPEADACEGPNPAGCSQDGCPMGQRCHKDRGECAPSACLCAEGEWLCTDDCGGGGRCVDEDAEITCEGPNPQGCARTGCEEGFVCETMPVTPVCIPSLCRCVNGQWACSLDCLGGVCQEE